MACGQDNLIGRELLAVCGGDAESAIVSAFYVRDAGIEMILPAVFHNAVADVLHHFRQLVGANVRMGVCQYLFRSAEGYQAVKDVAHVPALCGAREQLAVRERPRPAFAVAVIGVRIHHARPREGGHVRLAAVHVLAALQDHGLKPKVQELERGEHSRRARTHYYNWCGIVDILIFRDLEREILLPWRICGVPVAVDHILAGVDGALQKNCLRDGGGREAELSPCSGKHFLL